MPSVVAVIDSKVVSSKAFEDHPQVLLANAE